MKTKILTFCSHAESILKDNKNFAELFVCFKMEFFRKYQNGLIFSTRFGADFFREIKNRIINNLPITAENGEKLGEYDKNFNNWLKNI